MAMTGALRADQLRVLIVHNAYQERGGEDSVVGAEFDLLSKRGHQVEIYHRHNDELRAASPMPAALNSLWSVRSAREVDEVIQRFRPSVIHAHNVFPLISPSFYWRATALGVPVVQTLHNFRLLCPQAQLLRDGGVCEDCIGHLPWRAVQHACYRGSRVQSAVSAASISLHRMMGTYERHVSTYIALNEFCKRKFVQGGLPEDKIRIKPNFVDGPDVADDSPLDRTGALFVGRLSADKGLATLLAAAELYSCSATIVGTGEFSEAVSTRFGSGFVGFQPLPEILRIMRRASYLVVPSIWYENFPRTIVEAYACGLPVIASRLGALEEIVIEGETGLLFDPGSAADLAAKLSWADEHPSEMLCMGRNARSRYEAMYTPDRNYQTLINIYQDAMNLR